MNTFRFKHKKREGGIIVGGVLHSEKNNIGDRGVPVVHRSSLMKNGGKYDKNLKHAEIEKEELILNLESAQKLDKLVDEYIDCGCPGKLILIGKLIYKSLQNTSDETCRTNCVYEPKLNRLK